MIVRRDSPRSWERVAAVEAARGIPLGTYHEPATEEGLSRHPAAQAGITA